MATAANNPRDERIDLRLNGEVKRQIERAASLSGQTVSGFILGLAVPRALELVQASGKIELSERDSLRFLSALDAATPPSDALLRAAARYKASVV